MILRLLCGLLEVCDRIWSSEWTITFGFGFSTSTPARRCSRCRCWLWSSFGITGGVRFLPAASRVHWVAFSDSSIVASSRQVSSEHTFVLYVFSDVEAQRQEIRLGKRHVQDVTDAAVVGNCLFCLALVSPDSVILELAMLVSKHKGTLSDGWIRWNVNVGTSCSQQLFLQFFYASMILISSTTVH
jgi:hypothetical protein